MAKIFTKLLLGDAVYSAGGKMFRKLSVEIHTATDDGCILFSSPSSFTLNVSDNTKHWDGDIEYSTDTKTWNIWDGTTTLSADNGKLYLRGTSNTYITGNSGTAHWVLTGSDISCYGNIENLLDYAKVANGEHPQMAKYCYSRMFHSCTSLVSAPRLLATTLSTYCYNSMFYGCTSLIITPELPATTLSTYCYCNMFKNCTSLTNTPELPATTLAEGCYIDMFNGCTSLASAPRLPATKLAASCYENMFYKCTSLTNTPELPATTLASECYSNMFYGCTSLVSAPRLPATTLQGRCYYQMFRNCTSLTTIPELPSNYVEYKAYSFMFSGCTSVKLSKTQTDEYQTPYRIPTVGTGTAASNEMGLQSASMFADTGGTFAGTPSINTTYYTSNTVV